MYPLLVQEVGKGGESQALVYCVPTVGSCSYIGWGDSLTIGVTGAPEGTKPI